MGSIEEFLKLAQDCLGKARAAALPSEKAEHLRMGDQYLKAVEELRRARSVTQAARSKPGSKIGKDGG